MSTDFIRTGRPLGKGNLSDEMKLDILTQKKLQNVSQGKIAEQYGLARKTVNILTEDSLSPEAQLQLESVVEKYKKIHIKALNRLEQKLDKDQLNPTQLTNLASTAHNAVRLEQNQPTQIISGESTNRLASITQSIIERKRLEYAQNNLPIPSIDDVLTSLEDALKANNVSRESVKALLDKQAAESGNLDYSQD